MSRKKKYYNIFFSFGSQFIIISLGLIVPRIILTGYGSDTNGLTSTVTQIFTYMALLEAGIGQATRNALYKPVSEKNKGEISKIMSVSRHYYRKVTVFYGLIVVLLAALLPFVIKSKISYFTIFLVVLFEGMTQVISFWFTENWIQLLVTEGENYIKVNVEMVGRLAGYLVKIILALNGVNIAAIQAAYFIISLVKLFYYSRYMKKHYGWVDYSAADQSIKLNDRNSYIITEIAWTIFSSTDMIILSIYASTEMASVYSIYNLVFMNLNYLLQAVYLSTQYILGQNYYENKEKYIKTHDLFNSIYLGIMTTLMLVSYYLIIPFVRIYTDGVKDINYIYTALPILFCLVQILSWSRFVTGNLSGIAGYAKMVSKLSMVEAIINVVGSLILVRSYGIVGVLMATVIALPIKVVYLTWLSEKKILNRNGIKAVSILGINYLFFGLGVFVHSHINMNISTIKEFVIAGAKITPICFVIGFVLNGVVNPNLFHIVANKCQRILKK
ncbi:lipopolysaccharide biosynthesis protein [Butyrivibrio sp. WCD2001]|uniref:lipopolysaccharide biosynthesis protein n=1 Tax=Butyrivibrio sp. WCD2001 TaxID=1280681 RepID=UPI0003FDD132|nr:polysaccharide biosynthesis C-terminal domain-containing protein [Butyrivibrio sp. WCD2001]